MYSVDDLYISIMYRKCCLCGVDIPGSGASMCNDCIINNTNIAEGIEPEISITYCKQCNRYILRVGD